MSNIELLTTLFNSPKYGLTNLKQFIINVQKLHPDIFTKKEISDFYKNYDNIQKFKPHKE